MEEKLYKNYVELQGMVSDKVIWGISKNGRFYCSFQLVLPHVNSYHFSVDRNSKEFIRSIIFDRKKAKIATELKEKGFRGGLYVHLVGILQTTRTEFKGFSIIQLMVFVKEIEVLKPNNKNDNGTTRLQKSNS